MAEPITEALKVLQARLAQIPGIAQVMTEWPAPSQKLVYPTLSIFQGEPKFMNLQPYKLAATTPDTVTHELTTQYVCGEYDLTMQMDLWCKNKLERSQFIEKVMNAMNPKPDSVMGLSLQMPAYFNTWTHFVVTSHSIDDDGDAAQRQEWRARFVVLGNLKVVRTVTNVGIISVETTLQTSNT